MKSFAIISLGCPRNLVDSEVIAGSLRSEGYSQRSIESGVDVAVINTCAFVESAREESVDSIIAAGNLKKDGKVKYLVVCGCLSQLYRSKLSGKLPEADLLVGTSDFPRIVELVKGLGKRGKRSAVSAKLDYIYDEDSPRYILTPKHYAYLKISEGCSNRCSYCIISRLRGRLRSRPVESILAEARGLAGPGRVREIEIIGQDTTRYGADLYGKAALPDLLSGLGGIKDGVRWIRLLYTHPAHYSDELIGTIAGEEKICKYLDLPIQHVNDRILRLMNRKVTKREIVELIRKLRKKIPGLILRTSVIVGFPTETGREFKELLEFIKDTKFDRLGAFTYSRESGTRALRYGGQVPESIKTERYNAVMAVQRDISMRLSRKHLGKTVDVLIDEKVPGGKDRFIGRTQGDAPDIDGVVYLNAKRAKIGEFCRAKITDTLEYDLVGEEA